MKKHALPALLVLPAAIAANSVAAEEGWDDKLAKMVTDGSVKLDLRYRYEYVDQAGFDDEADAALLRSRITLESAPLNGFNVLLEADDVRNVGPNDYNSTENGKTEYPVIADPEYTEINQAWLRYKMEKADGTLGRQRINHGNQRFIGGVGWRNNEQTYDGFRANWEPLDGLKLDLSYIYNVNRIFGPDDGANPADLEGDHFFLRADYQISDAHRVTGFGYFLDIDEDNTFAAAKTVDNSTDTYGLEYSGKFDWLSVTAAYATQSEAGDSTLEYDADYYNIELAATFRGIDLKAGYEVLESGDDDETGNNIGFKTPLATLHKFQGWADKFLNTPADGIEDAWVHVGGKVGPVKLAAIYHDFQAESSSEDYGTEWDLVATWPVTDKFSVQGKWAGFDSDSDLYDDTDKYWLTLHLKL